MIVSKAELEQSLARAAAAVRDPRGGIHGRDSTAWKIQREAVIFLGGGRATLLQLAHPFVAYAIDQHSKTRSDVLGRFQRTFANIFAMSFGDLDQAMTAARRVHAIHTRITGVISDDLGPRYPAGTRYHANDTDAQRWVHATLLHGAVQSYELVLGTLPAAIKEAYYQDGRQFARLFAIREDDLPPTWAAFDLEFERTLASPMLVVSEPARAMSRFLFGDHGDGKRTAIGRWLELVTTGLLPERLRRGYGLAWGLRERAAFAGSIAAMSLAYRLVPRPLRVLPAYVDAERRVAGLGPSALSRFMERRLFALASLATGT